MSRGFVQTGGILHQRIRTASESRGFAETRLLTQWREIVGEATASIAQPVKVGYGRQGFGATLTLLTNGANAPIVQAESAKIRERVNACYGYAAISTIRITQTAQAGFSEPAAAYQPPKADRPLDPEKVANLDNSLRAVDNASLRSALAALGENILTRNND